MTSVITGAGGGVTLYRQEAASREKNEQKDEKDVQKTAPLVASFQR